MVKLSTILSSIATVVSAWSVPLKVGSQTSMSEAVSEEDLWVNQPKSRNVMIRPSGASVSWSELRPSNLNKKDGTLSFTMKKGDEVPFLLRLTASDGSIVDHGCVLRAEADPKGKYVFDLVITENGDLAWYPSEATTNNFVNLLCNAVQKDGTVDLSDRTLSSVVWDRRPVEVLPGQGSEDASSSKADTEDNADTVDSMYAGILKNGSMVMRLPLKVARM